MALDAASYAASWAIYDATGVRPEYLWPVLYSESGLNPGIPNAQGAPYYGINQASGSYLATLGITPADYLTWPASRQLTAVVLPMVRSNVARWGPIGSGTRFYQSNFLPATLGSRALMSPLAWAGSAYYRGNPGLDVWHRGVITVGDLAVMVSRAASSQAVRAAIAASYAARPSAGPPLSPALGTDYLPGWVPLAAVGALEGAAWWLA